MSKLHENSSVLTVRFVGEELKTKGLPIYELGTVFISLQRLVHKAHLAAAARLEKGSTPTKEERKVLALQIHSHEKHSDFYAPVPFLTDPNTFYAVKNALDFVLHGIASYALERVLDVVTGEKDERKQIYIGAIHADVVNIVNRIENVGGCDSIEIGAPPLAPDAVVKFTKTTKAYTHLITDKVFLGAVQVIEGRAFKLYPNIAMVEIRRPGGRTCKAFLDEKNFESVRYGQIKSPYLRITGRPRYRIGMEGKSFDEFEATAVELFENVG